MLTSCSMPPYPLDCLRLLYYLLFTLHSSSLTLPLAQNTKPKPKHTSNSYYNISRESLLSHDLLAAWTRSCPFLCSTCNHPCNLIREETAGDSKRRSQIHQLQPCRFRSWRFILRVKPKLSWYIIIVIVYSWWSWQTRGILSYVDTESLSKTVDNGCSTLLRQPTPIQSNSILWYNIISILLFVMAIPI